MSWLSSGFHSLTGRSITSTFRAALPAVAGATLPGIGGVLAGGLASSLVPGEQGGTPVEVASADPTAAIADLGRKIWGQITNISGPMPGMSIQPTYGAAPGAGKAGALVAGALIVGNVIKSAAGRILGFILPSGAKISAEAAVKLAKEVGLTAAAAAIGVGVTDLAELIFKHDAKHKHRRGRGISAAQLRTTTRTIRRVETMHRRIASIASHAVHHRRASPRVVEVVRSGRR